MFEVLIQGYWWGTADQLAAVSEIFGFFFCQSLFLQMLHMFLLFSFSSLSKFHHCFFVSLEQPLVKQSRVSLQVLFNHCFFFLLSLVCFFLSKALPKTSPFWIPSCFHLCVVFFVASCFCFFETTSFWSNFRDATKRCFFNSPLFSKCEKLVFLFVVAHCGSSQVDFFKHTIKLWFQRNLKEQIFKNRLAFVRFLPKLQG